RLDRRGHAGRLRAGAAGPATRPAGRGRPQHLRAGRAGGPRRRPTVPHSAARQSGRSQTHLLHAVRPRGVPDRGGPGDRHRGPAGRRTAGARDRPGPGRRAGGGGLMTAAIIAGVLVAAGVYLLFQRGLVRVTFGFVLLGHAANVILVAAGGMAWRGAPLLGSGGTGAMADPLPQAFVLTAIVITFGITVYLFALARSGGDPEPPAPEPDTEPDLDDRDTESDLGLPASAASNLYLGPEASQIPQERE